MPWMPETPPPQLTGIEVTPKMNETWAALMSLAYPPEGVKPVPPPPVAVKLTFYAPDSAPYRRNEYQFRIEFTNGTVLWGDLRNLSGSRA